MTKSERSWILYDCANSAQTLIITTAILPIYFKQFVTKGMAETESTFYWGLGNTLAGLIVALVAPVLGSLADQRGNKKRLFVVFLVIGVIATMALALVGEGQWKLCLLIYGLSTIGFYGSVVFYDSFLVDVTEKERMDWVSASGFAWGYVASTIPFALCMALIMMHKQIGFASSVQATRLAFVITAAWWLLLSIPMIRNVHQVHGIEATDKPLRDSLSRLLATAKEIRKYKQLVLFLIAYFCYIDGVQTIYKMSMVFGLDVGITSQQLLVILFVTQLVAFPFAILFGRLAKVFGTKNMLFAGIGVYFAVAVFAYFISTVTHFWILAMMVAVAQGGLQALSRSFYGKLVPKNAAGEFFGFYDIFGKFGTVGGPLLVGIIANMTGDTRKGVLSLIVLFAVGAVALTFVRDDSEAHTDVA